MQYKNVLLRFFSLHLSSSCMGRKGHSAQAPGFLAIPHWSYNFPLLNICGFLKAGP